MASSTILRAGANPSSAKATAFANTMPTPTQSAQYQSSHASSGSAGPALRDAPRDRERAQDVPAAAAPVELEHMIGLSTRFRNTAQWLLAASNSAAGPDKRPSSALSKFVYSVGSTVALGDLSDPHKQRFMNGHDDLVSAIAVSPTGHLIASGQLGSKAAKGESSPVCLWDTRTGSRLLQLEGLCGQVLSLSFSPDGKLLAASGLNSTVIVWQLEALGQQGQAPSRWEAAIVHTERVPAPATCAQFSPALLAGSSRYPVYTLITTPGDKVRKTSLQFDTRTMGFAAETVAFSFPARGLVRNYVRCAFEEKGESLFIATEAGDVVVLNVPNAIFRAAVQVSSNGVRGVAVRGDCLFAAAGDGIVKRFRGADAVWNADAQVKLGEALSSLSWHGSTPAGELLVSGERGRLFTVSCDSLQAKVAAESSASPVRAACFGRRADSFCSIGQDGSIMVWDLADYSVPVRTQVPAEGLCLGFAEDGSIVCGCADGAIRCYGPRDGKELWSIPNAHRGAVLCLSFGPEHVMSGGEDGYVRVWQLGTRRMVGAYLAHKGPVRSVVADVKNPRRVHSCGDDKSIVTFDLHTEQRVATHLEPSGPLTALCQKIDGDNEVVTVSSHGHIAVWDADIDEAVARVVDPGRTRLSSVHLSPNGKLFAVAGDDGFVKIYSIATSSVVPAAPSRPAVRGAPSVPASSVQLQLQLVAACKGHSAPVTSVRWAPDQRQLVSTGSDGAICVWNFYG